MKPTTFISLFFLLSFINLSLAKENKGYSSNHQSTNKTNAGCIASTAQTDLNINNVRAHILNGGDLWWDYNNNSNGQYEVPLGQKR